MTISDPVERLFAPRANGTPPLLLAPMAGVTDAPFRALATRYGADLTVSEMIASQAMIRGIAKCLKMSQGATPEATLAVQIAGADPEAMAEAARMQAELGAEIIDINMGCPVKKIVGTGAGAALLRDERHAARIMEAVVSAVKVPVTVKIRLGWDDQSRNGLAMARLAQESGMRMLTVHGRTRAQMYTGQADWEAIGAIKESVSIPVVGNGDVTSPELALKWWKSTGVDGIMIGRAALGRPWLFGQIARYLASGTPGEPPSLAERGAVIIDHFHAMIAHHGPKSGHLLARKHLGWFTRGYPDGAAFRDRINHAPHPEAVLTMLREFLDQAAERAA
ncbi:MAG: tRNA dihydrouridine synthase DusB [Magnetococcales bacterium]|nr:tRNA dihydrouridine synthase DusB [Magnetococcales bacterium]MBF0262380.1 tRNA dihydrouridine synthase DusB [Magnetococcales bacterium]